MEGNLSLVVQSGAIKFLKGLRPFFYVEPPSESCFQRVEDVPQYLQKVWHVKERVGVGGWGGGRGSCCSQSEDVHELYTSIWIASPIAKSMINSS